MRKGWLSTLLSGSDTESGTGETNQKTEADSARSDGAWAVGGTIDDTYRIDQVFDGGGMGLVYRVRHLGWDTEMAMKVPRVELAHEPVFMENFHRECQSWIDLGFHRNVVGCFYLRIVDSIPAVFVEYVDGGSLGEWVSDRRLYVGSAEEILERALRILIQSARGVQHAHSIGLIHQDIKPANILMTGDGQPRLADFGLARARGLASAAQPAGGEQTTLVTMGGYTPLYCSPEQALGQRLSRSTDVWSWAASMLEVLNGGVSWRTGPEVAHGLEALTADDSARAVATVPQALVALLQDCFHPDPDKRISDFGVVIDRLDEIYDDTFGAALAEGVDNSPELLASAHNNRAVSLADLNETDRAVAEFEQALQLDPLHPEATFNLALLRWYWQEASGDDVIAQIQRTRLGNPASGRSNMLEARFALREYRADRAVECWRDAMLAMDTRPAAAVRLAESLMAVDEFEEAGRCFEVAAMSLPHSERVRSGLRLAKQQTRVANGSILYSRLNSLATLTDVGAKAALRNDARSCVFIDTSGNLQLWQEGTDEPPQQLSETRCRGISSNGRFALFADDHVVVTDTHDGTRRIAVSDRSLDGSEAANASTFEIDNTGRYALSLTTMDDKGGWAGGVIGHFPDAEIWTAEVNLLDLVNGSVVERFALTLDRYRTPGDSIDDLTTCIALSSDGQHAYFSAGRNLFHHRIGGATTTAFECSNRISVLAAADYGGDVYVGSGSALLRLDGEADRLFPLLDIGVDIDALSIHDSRIAVANTQGRVSVRTSDGADEVAVFETRSVFDANHLGGSPRVADIECASDRILVRIKETCQILDLPAIASDRTIGAQMAIAPVSMPATIDAAARNFNDELAVAREFAENGDFAAAAERLGVARGIEGFARHPAAMDFAATRLSQLPKGELALVWSESLLRIDSKQSGAIAVDMSDQLYAIRDSSIVAIGLCGGDVRTHAGEFGPVVCAVAAGEGLVLGFSSGEVALWRPGQDAATVAHKEHQWQMRDAALNPAGT